MSSRTERALWHAESKAIALENRVRRLSEWRDQLELQVEALNANLLEVINRLGRG